MTEHPRLPARPRVDELSAHHPAGSGAVPSGHAEHAPQTRPGRFADDPTRQPRHAGTAFLRLRVLPRVDGVLELAAEIITADFAGRSRACFRRPDLESFLALSRGFSAGSAHEASLKGGAFAGESGFSRVLVCLYAYRPHDQYGCAALRVVVASPQSDDLLTATLRTTPLMLAQFADQLDAMIHAARDVTMLIGQ